MNKIKNNILIITGAVQEGKTTFAQTIFEGCSRQNISVHGFLSLSSHQNGERTGFNLQNLQDSKTYPLADIHYHEGWKKYRKFYFNPETLILGNQILKSAPDVPKNITIVDETGPLEIEGYGWDEGLRHLLSKNKRLKLFVIRKNIINQAIEKYKIKNAEIVNINKFQPQKVINNILQMI